MSINPISAANFYAAAKPATQPEPGGSSPQSSFGQFATDLVDTIQQGENTAKAAMTGNADMPSLVEALAKSELAVQTAVTVRDKVVQAYQEILRMPV
jgi:flagellar hook-basal body complex protein FliE